MCMTYSPQPFDVSRGSRSVAVVQLGEHLVGVLTEQWWVAVAPRGKAPHLHGIHDRRDVADAWNCNRREQSDRAQVLIVEDLTEVVDGTGRHAALLEFPDPGRGGCGR